MDFLRFLCDRVTSPALPVCLTAAGIFLFVALRGYPFRTPRRLFRALTQKREGGVSPFRALTVALAGTLGVGNIAGVAAAIAVGGPGAVFWMWVSAFLAMIVKYAEIVLAIRYRRPDGNAFHGGAMYYMTGNTLPALFAAVIVGASFPLGNLVQIRAASEAAEQAAGIPPVAVGILCAGMILAVVGGGARRVSALTVRMIPFLTALYVGMSVIVLIARRAALPGVLGAIWRDAFSFRAAAGGGIGAALSAVFRSPALRYGVTRGVMSNEAGCGTAPMAHASACTDSPAAQGCWGIFEVFCDTVLLCTLTALVVLTSGVELPPGGSGMDLAQRAFGTVLGDAAAYLLCVSALLFALSTVICWAYYGLEALRYLTRSRAVRAAYIAAYALAAVYGSVAVPSFPWLLADLAVGVLTVINTVSVCARADEIRAETVSQFAKLRRERGGSCRRAGKDP